MDRVRASEARDAGSIPAGSTIRNMVRKFTRALARCREKGVGEIRIGLAGKGEFGGWAK